MDDIAHQPTDRAKRNGMVGLGTILVFDGKGGVTRHENSAEHPIIPAKGFKLVAGNSKSPDFKVWLREELGPFYADMLTAPTTRARCTIMEDKALVMLRVVRPSAAPDDLGRQLLTLWLEKGRVIIASELNVVDFLGLARWEVSNYAPVSPADLVARLGLRAADRLEPLLEMLGDKLDEIEETLITRQTEKAQDRLEHLRRTLINFRRLVWPQRDVLNTLEIEDLSFFTEKDRLRLREAAARSSRIGDELQALSERAVLVREQIMDERAEKLNRTMLLLAAVTVVFMPLTLITGVLGINVSGIPFADSPHAFWSVCIGLTMLSLGIVWWMRKKHWL
ncbi:MAG: CorA family divalent cation transporter [Candidatus Devosia phytovorans]|uniref:CorA family divalent cation transporter n=1 Tax=Candidatus Devosia phytovorans TaxID=3121372 RepID=A0AAJ5VYS0_9HYPH|nr:CorA family divalent cation transporter [Devosia sp.]WEK06345.1 MAG: CorA family divalent cation transporter [Devosia sp.]